MDRKSFLHNYGQFIKRVFVPDYGCARRTCKTGDKSAEVKAATANSLVEASRKRTMLPFVRPSVRSSARPWLVTDANSERIIQLVLSYERRNARSRALEIRNTEFACARNYRGQRESSARAGTNGFTRVDKVGVAALCNVRDAISAYR